VIWAVGLLAACATAPADLVLRNGKIVTVDDAIPEAEIPNTRVVHTILGGRVAYTSETEGSHADPGAAD